MPKRSSKPVEVDAPKKKLGNRTGRQGPPDPNVQAFNTVMMAIGEMEPPKPPEKNQAAVTLGRLGGLKGGVARAAKLTPEQRKAIAEKAAAKRWEKD
jgi:hypothetical protein